MSELLLLAIALLAAGFVGFNIGGATTAPAFGPAVGASLVSKGLAGGLMAAFFAVGAWTIGRRVVDTLGNGLVGGADVFTLRASVVVLGFVGLALFVGNRFEVPASTSMTTVGAIAGLGMASGDLDWAVFGEIVVWWVVAPLLGFGAAVAIGRYYYPRVEEWMDVHEADDHLLEVDRTGTLPSIRLSAGHRDELVGGGIVLGVGCLMAFSSGSSNIANVIAPLVGSGSVEVDPGIVLGSIAVAAGALTIARRTLETLGNEITALPLPAAIVVAPVSAALVVVLSALGIPASFVVIATLSIAGIGFGRSLRNRSGGVVADGGTDPEDGIDFDPATTTRVLLLQHTIPAFATFGAYVASVLFLV